jgi:hypothetical protein
MTMEPKEIEPLSKKFLSDYRFSKAWEPVAFPALSLSLRALHKKVVIMIIFLKGAWEASPLKIGDWRVGLLS